MVNTTNLAGLSSFQIIYDLYLYFGLENLCINRHELIYFTEIMNQTWELWFLIPLLINCMAFYFSVPQLLNLQTCLHKTSVRMTYMWNLRFNSCWAHQLVLLIPLPSLLLKVVVVFHPYSSGPEGEGIVHCLPLFIPSSFQASHHKLSDSPPLAVIHYPFSPLTGFKLHWLTVTLKMWLSYISWCFQYFQMHSPSTPF